MAVFRLGFPPESPLRANSGRACMRHLQTSSAPAFRLSDAVSASRRPNNRLRILAEYQSFGGIVICAAAWSLDLLSLRGLDLPLVARRPAGAPARRTADG